VQLTVTKVFKQEKSSFINTFLVYQIWLLCLQHIDTIG